MNFLFRVRINLILILLVIFTGCKTDNFNRSFLDFKEDLQKEGVEVELAENQNNKQIILSGVLSARDEERFIHRVCSEVAPTMNSDENLELMVLRKFFLQGENEELVTDKLILGPVYLLGSDGFLKQK